MPRADLPNTDASSELRNLGMLISPDAAGERLDAFLGKNYPFLSRSAWQKRIADKGLCINGNKVKASYKLQSGDQIQMVYPEEWEPTVPTDLKIIYKEDDIAAVFKPSGLPMHEGGRFFRQHFTKSLKDLLGDEWAAVHRLDRETSGIVMCGRTYDVRSKLSVSFEDREVQKTYLCIGRGQAPSKSWLVDEPIGDLKDSEIRIKKWVVPDGLPSQTEFECVEQAMDCALLKARPRTGRTNQIRIHAAYSGLVLLGDRLYHPDEKVFIHYHENGEHPWQNEQTGADRLCLHAHELQFRHPFTQELITMTSPLPADMEAIWTNEKSKKESSHG